MLCSEKWMYFHLFLIKPTDLSFFAALLAKFSMFLIASIFAGLKKNPDTLLKTTASRGKMSFEWSESRAPGLLGSCTGKWHWVYEMDLIWHNPVALSTELEFHCVTGLTNQREGQHRKAQVGVRYEMQYVKRMKSSMWETSLPPIDTP